MSLLTPRRGILTPMRSGPLTGALGRATAGLLVVLLAVATAGGLLSRLKPADAPYFLLTREVSNHPILAVVFFAVCLALYVTAFRWLCRRLDAWRDGAGNPPPGHGRLYRITEWACQRWWRISLVLFVAWLPWYLSSYPGQPSPDAANMLTEFLRHRSDFAGATYTSGPNDTPPYIDYPTSFYLLGDSDSLWSNHHPLFLMMGYGAICAASAHLFDSLVPGLMFISALSAIFTLVAFGRAFGILAGYVRNWKVRATALVITAASPLIPLWSMAEHKNQLFCAAFVWWLALLARLMQEPGAPRRRWYVETTFVSLVMAISVQFGWMVLALQAVLLLAWRGRRVPALLALAAPAALVAGSIAAITSQGGAIASDPVETKGVQMMTIALIVREHPDALTAEQLADLDKIFRMSAMAAVFDASSTDPLKSTGPLNLKTPSFRYETVQAADWEKFNAIWIDLMKRYPGTTLDAGFMKSYRYFDPIDEGTDWYPPWSPAYERSIGEYQVAPLEVNHLLRGGLRAGANFCYEEVAPCRVVVSHNPRTVLIVLLCAAALAVRRRHAWLWTAPFALQVLIAGASPLSAGGRYVLASTYGLGILLMLLAMRDPDHEADEPDEPAAPAELERANTHR